jgi:hypothetical protein
MHGLSAALLYVGAWAFWVLAPTSHAWAGTPYLLLHVIPVASAMYAFIHFPGSKLWHLLQLANLFCIAQTLFIGSMAATGEWL